MSIATIPTTSKAPCRLDVTISPSHDVLLRVLTTLRRRGCDIRAVDFAAADRHRPARLSVAVTLPARDREQVARWVLGLVDVLHVEVAAGGI